MSGMQARPADTADGCGAQFSPCKRYRYSLWRLWDSSVSPLLVIGLNPSTATATADDPTIRRCIAYARAWGHGGLVMCNLFAFRATDPRAMKAATYPTSEAMRPRTNDFEIEIASRSAGRVLAAWGVHGAHRDRDRNVIEIFDRCAALECLGVTRAGFPRHPLYMRKDAQPIPYKGRP